MAGNQQRRVAQVLLRSALKPVHIVLLVISLLMVVDTPPVARLIGLLGLILYGVLLWHDANSPVPADEAPGEEDEREREAAPVASAYGEPMAKAADALRRIHAAVDGADRSLARVLTPIKRQADQVVQRLSGLVHRAQQLDGFLARQNREHLQQEIGALDERIAASTDEFAREQYLEARRTREEQLRSYDELSLFLGRIQAQITNVLSSLEAAEAKVIVLQAADMRHAGLVTDTVSRSLQELSQEMTGFEESIDATIAVRMRQ